MVKVKVKEYSSCFLPESCSQYTGISCSPDQESRDLVLARFGFSSAQPLVKVNIYNRFKLPFFDDLITAASSPSASGGFDALSSSEGWMSRAIWWQMSQ